MQAREETRDKRILVLAPTGKDAVLTARFFREAGLSVEICEDVSELCRKLNEGAGIIFLTEEVLTVHNTSCVIQELRGQPTWSDIPLIVLTAAGGESPTNIEAIRELGDTGNVTLIDRPVRLMTLISTVKSALRARNRQYEARDFLIAEIISKEAVRQSEERLRFALNAARLGAWQLSLDDYQLECTDLCKANFGRKPHDSFTYEDLFEAIHPDDRERVKATINQAVKMRKEYEAEYRVTWLDDSLHWIFASGSVSYDENGEPKTITGVTLDITERKNAEKEREMLLERERLARAEAETANRLKDEFLATVSHELRTPLNAMLGWMSLLRTNKLAGKDSERALEIVERNARTQALIIEDLLDVSRIITGKLHLKIKPVEPAQLIKSAVDSLKPAADAKEISIQQIEEDEPSSVMGDPGRIQQVIWNLLSNAIKFTPRGGEVEIKLSTEQECLAISISDTGAGIDPKFLPFVFDRFLQADGTSTRTYSGLGLGLAIVRHLVELHGGVVKAESDGEGKGSTFTVRLPLLPKQKTEVKTAQKGAVNYQGHLANGYEDSLKGLKILIVEDEVDSLEFLKFFLEQCGAQVSGANSVTSAIECLKKTIPDLIVSDIGLPEADGYEFIETVRSLPPERGGNVPAVALTAYARNEDKLRALSSGFQTHLSKPVDTDELIATVVHIVKQG